MDRHVFVVLSNPVPGREDEYNAWYSDRHINEVIQLDGFIDAQRFRLSNQPSVGDAPYDYLAVYGVADVERAAASLDRAKRERDAQGNAESAFLHRPTAFAEDRRGWWYSAITDLRRR